MSDKVIEEGSSEQNFKRALQLEKKGMWDEAISEYEELATSLSGTQEGGYALTCAHRLREQQANGRIATLETQLQSAKEQVAEAQRLQAHAESRLIQQYKKNWKFYVFNIMAIFAAFSALWIANPSQQSLEADYKARLAKDHAEKKTGLAEHLIKVALADLLLKFDTHDWRLFRVGTVRVKGPIGPSVEIKAIGALGHWWYLTGDTSGPLLLGCLGGRTHACDGFCSS